MNARHIGIIGAGLMGHGIAYLFARAGHEVYVQDPSAAARDALPERLRQICALLAQDASLLERVHAVADLPAAVTQAALVFEATPELLPLKRALFAQLDELAPAEAILASNTSALPIHQISAGLGGAHRIVGAHFWNPPHLVRLVEVVMSEERNRIAAETLVGILRAVGQHPVLLRRDIPGIIGNRLQQALKREAIALVAAGVCDAETIDDVVKHGLGARLAVLGPLEQSDLVGLDLQQQIMDVLTPLLDNTPHTHPYLQALVARGELGMKTGKGFRDWTAASAQAVRDRLDHHLKRAAEEAARSRS